MWTMKVRIPSLLRSSSPTDFSTDDLSVKMEIGSDGDSDTPISKKRKYDDAMDASSDARDGSELADLAKAGLEHEMTA